MQLFNKPGTSKQLEKESNKILDVFTKTVDSLKLINETASTSINEGERKKAEIEAEIASLNVIKTKNQTVIGKIEKLFE